MVRHRLGELHKSKSEANIQKAPECDETDAVRPENERLNERKDCTGFVFALAIFLFYTLFVLVAVLTAVGNYGWKLISIDFRFDEFIIGTQVFLVYTSLEFCYHLKCFFTKREFTKGEDKAFKLWRFSLFIAIALEVVFCIFVLFFIFLEQEEHACSTFNERCWRMLAKIFWIPVCHAWSIALICSWRRKSKKDAELRALADQDVNVEIESNVDL